MFFVSHGYMDKVYTLDENGHFMVLLRLIPLMNFNLDGRINGSFRDPTHISVTSGKLHRIKEQIMTALLFL